MLIIRTPYGRRYKVNAKGEFDNGSGFSGQWKMLGLSHVKRNEFIPFQKLTKEMVNNIRTTWKNGKPQWTVRDLDHGTVREWGNTAVHGVNGIWFE
jgi:hypothetical protein